MRISEIDIENYAATIGVIAGQHTSIWATSMPSVVNRFLFGPSSILFDMRFNIVNFTNEGILLIAVDSVSGYMRQEYIYIRISDIISIQLKKKMTAMNLCVKTGYGEILYKVNGTMIGAKWHKTNLPNIIEWINRINAMISMNGMNMMNSMNV